VPDLRQRNEFVAEYWKNGAPTLLSNGTHNSYTTDISVIGNDVYVTGYESTQIQKQLRSTGKTELQCH